MDSLNNLQISCMKCNVPFKLGDHVVMTKKTDFFHLLCFKSKGRVYRFFNKAINFVTWSDSKLMLKEYVAAMEKLMKKNGSEDKVSQETQVLELSNVMKTEYAPTKDNNEIAGNDTGDVCRSDSTLSSSKANVLSDNLVQLMTDVNDLKEQINYFADEKNRDESLIKSLQLQRQTLKKQIFELRWQLQINSDSSNNTTNEL